MLYGGRLGTNLYELGFITEERLQEALARAHGVPPVKVDPRAIQPEAVALISKSVAARHKAIPYQVKGKTLYLLMVDPQDHTAVAAIGYSLGYIVRPVVVPEFRMIQLLRDHYGIDERWRYVDTRRGPAPTALAELDAAALVERLEGAETRDAVVEALLALCSRSYRRVLFFIVREPWVLGWAGLGEGVDQDLATGLKFPLDKPSVFQGVARDRTVFIGRLPPEEENERFMKAVGKRPTTNAIVFPVAVKGRVVNLVYCDNGPAGNVKGDLGELMVHVQKIPRAYLRIIRRRVAETRKLTGAAPAGEEIEDE